MQDDVNSFVGWAMNDDVVIFLISAGLLVIYLIFSALTEMGTKLPWKK